MKKDSLKTTKEKLQEILLKFEVRSNYPEKLKEEILGLIVQTACEMVNPKKFDDVINKTDELIKFLREREN